MTEEENLVGKTREYKIDGEKYFLKPLEIFADNCFEITVKLSETKTKAEGAKDLIEKTLKKSGVKKKDFPLSAMNDLVNACMEVNGLKEDDSTTS